jgi:hypothetical protein
MKKYPATLTLAAALAPAALVAALAACSPAQQAPTTTSSTVPTTTTTTTTTPVEDFVSRATPIGTDFQVAELEDGLYIGFLQAVSAEGLTGGKELQLDLAVWFDGDEADRMASEDGEESPRPNGYYIRNLDPSHLLLVVSDNVEVTSIWYQQHPDLSRSPITYAQLVEVMNGSGTGTEGAMRASPWWITIVDGEVVSIDEQYVP